MTYYSELVDMMQSTAIHKKLVGGYPFQSLALGGLEIEKNWSFQKEIHPHGSSIHLNFENCQHLFDVEPKKAGDSLKLVP